MPVRQEIVIPNDTKYLAAIRKLVAQVCEEAGFPRQEVNLVTLAVDEAVTNIIEHAYERDSQGEMAIEISIQADSQQLEITLRDFGRNFDLARVPRPSLPEHVKAGRRHGLGVFLMRQIMDRVNYTCIRGVRNELQLVKFARPKA